MVNVVKKVVKKCIKNGCVKRRKDNTCLAFIEPVYQWKNGECYGFTSSSEELRKLYDQAWNYRKKSQQHGGKTPRNSRLFVDALEECLSLHELENDEM